MTRIHSRRENGGRYGECIELRVVVVLISDAEQRMGRGIRWIELVLNVLRSHVSEAGKERERGLREVD